MLNDQHLFVILFHKNYQVSWRSFTFVTSRVQCKKKRIWDLRFFACISIKSNRKQSSSSNNGTNRRSYARNIFHTFYENSALLGREVRYVIAATTRWQTWLANLQLCQTTAKLIASFCGVGNFRKIFCSQSSRTTQLRRLLSKNEWRLITLVRNLFDEHFRLFDGARNKVPRQCA